MTTTQTPTPHQVAALLKLSATYQDAAAADVHPSTLAALARLGLVDRTWTNSSLRGGEHWSYRRNLKGYLAIGEARRAAKAGE